MTASKGEPKRKRRPLPKRMLVTSNTEKTDAMDFDKEENERTEWSQRSMKETPTYAEFLRIATLPLVTCEDECESRDFSGEDACECIRRRFPSPAHYKLYKVINSRFSELQNLGKVAKAAAIVAKEKDDVDKH